MARVIRYVIAGLAVLVCAWFAVGVRQVRELNTASQLIDNPTTERDPAVARQAASALDAAGFLYPGTDVEVLRAQLAGNRLDYAQANRLLDQATASEPSNLRTWIAYLALDLIDHQNRNSAELLSRMRSLDPLDFPRRH